MSGMGEAAGHGGYGLYLFTSFGMVCPLQGGDSRTSPCSCAFSDLPDGNWTALTGLYNMLKVVSELGAVDEQQASAINHWTSGE